MAEGLLDKFKMLIGVEDIEEDEDDEEEVQAVKTAPVSQIASGAAARRPAYPERTTEFYSQPAADRRDNKVVRMQNNTAIRPQQMKLLVIEPKDLNECPKIVDNLRNKKPVIVNLERLDNDTARRIFDFLSGAVYSIDGSMSKVANNNIFVIAPDNVEVQLGEAESTLAARRASDSPWRK